MGADTTQAVVMRQSASYDFTKNSIIIQVIEFI
jgi:hypothetical protein